MALDVGESRIGVALSDPLRITAQPHSTIERKEKNYFTQIATLIQKENVGSIVVGMPYELSGNLGPQGEKVQVFIDKLTAFLKKNAPTSNIPIKIWDERFTTTAAERVLIGSKLKNSDRSAALDRVSAALILESYMTCTVVDS